MIALSATVGDLAPNIAALNKATSPLAAESERLVVLLQSTGAPVIQVSAADHVRILTERLHRNGGSMLASSEVSDGAFAEFSRDFRAAGDGSD